MSIYTPKRITSSNNPLIKHLVKVRQENAYRNKCRLLMVSGYKLVKELSLISEPLQIFTTDAGEYGCAEVYEVSMQVLKKLTGLINPEGIAAIFKLPAITPLEFEKRVLICDSIADPGNLGTLMRTALALGFDGIFLLGHGADPFQEKVVRASRGALFKIHYEIGNWDRLRELTQKRRASCWVADINGEPVHRVLPCDELFLLMSNESLGVSPEASRFGRRVSIPMSGQMESLNVSIAGAILMYCLSTKH